MTFPTLTVDADDHTTFSAFIGRTTLGDSEMGGAVVSGASTHKLKIVN